jgi:hypothetical protein
MGFHPDPHGLWKLQAKVSDINSLISNYLYRVIGLRFSRILPSKLIDALVTKILKSVGET